MRKVKIFNEELIPFSENTECCVTLSDGFGWSNDIHNVDFTHVKITWKGRLPAPLWLPCCLIRCLSDLWHCLGCLHVTVE